MAKIERFLHKSNTQNKRRNAFLKKCFPRIAVAFTYESAIPVARVSKLHSYKQRRFSDMNGREGDTQLIIVA